MKITHPRHLVLTGAACLLLSACASHKVEDTIFTDSSRGTVYLQRVDDSWFKTAHPLSVNPQLLSHVLRGVQIHEPSADTTTAVRVFSDEDTEFLSPLMSTALSKATKNQLVGFRISQDTNAGAETTGGVLYLQGRLLHLTLTHYRARIGVTDTGGFLSRQSFNPTGLSPRQIGFTPNAVKRSSRNEPPDLTNTPSIATLVIDHEQLGTEVKSQSRPIQVEPPPKDNAPVTHQQASSISPGSDITPPRDAQASSSEEIGTVKKLLMHKASELDVLAEEVRALQRRLADIQSRTPSTVPLDSQRPGPTPLTP
jgi:hypothetical protein